MADAPEVQALAARQHAQSLLPVAMDVAGDIYRAKNAFSLPLDEVGFLAIYRSQLQFARSLTASFGNQGGGGRRGYGDRGKVGWGRGGAGGEGEKGRGGA